MIQVKVYRNLKHGKKAKPLYSIQHKGKVIATSHCVLLVNAEFKVSEAGRQRVLKEGRKNVHAFVVGLLPDEALHKDWEGHTLPQRVTYNPYVGPYFMANDRPLVGTSLALLNEHGCTVSCYRLQFANVNTTQEVRDEQGS